MTTATLTDPIAPTEALDPAAQVLIDTRLDTIDRMLVGQVPRADRLAIVREVEAQLYDHLADRTPDDTDRDAVLAALGRLDPPEAYLPDESTGSPRTMPISVTRRPPLVTRPSGSPSASVSFELLGKVGGILGLSSLVLLIPAALCFYLTISSEGGSAPLLGFVGLLLLDIITSVLAIIFSSSARLRNPFAILGLTTGIISLLGSIGLVLITFVFG